VARRDDGLKICLINPRGRGTWALPKGWIGFTTSGPHSESVSDDGQIVTYFDYPTIVTVDGHSPAEQAGIMRGDELVAYNGLDVVGRALNLTQLLVPEKKLLVTIRRGGETKDYPVIVAKASERIALRRLDFDGLPLEFERAQIERARVQGRAEAAGSAIFAVPKMGANIGSLPMGGQLLVIAPNGVFGASAYSVGPELARALKLETGVLVNDVPEETPASRAGLRPGDVIVSVAGCQVASLHELQRLIETRAADRSVALRIMRDKKPRNITVRW
jgi:S1-C subfamily serine protease